MSNIITELLILRHAEGPITTLTLHRPDRRNALSRGLVEALLDRLENLAASPDARVLILKAQGPAFCAGLDLMEAAEILAEPDAEGLAIEDMNVLATMLTRLHSLPQATIAVVQGDALGGGAGLALACDFVLMAHSAHLGFPEVLRGLVPAIVLQDLVRQVGDRVARRLVLTGELVSAEQARDLGLVTDAIPDAELDLRADQLARQILHAGPQAIAITKQLLDDATGRRRDLQRVATLSAQVRCSPEAHEGLASFLERRPAAWVPK